MSRLHPYRQEQISKWLGQGGQVAAIVGPKRSGLTKYVNSLLPIWGNNELGGGTRFSIDLRRHSQPNDVLSVIAAHLNLENLPANDDDLSQVFLDASIQKVCLWCFENFHRATPDTQRLLLTACLNSSLPHGTSALSNFIFEGAVDFENLLANCKNSVQALVAHVEPPTPWQVIVEVEQLISSLSSARYPRSFVAWLTDITRGDTGFCREFLIRLHDPTPTRDTLNSTYTALVDHGATARELRAAAKQFDHGSIKQLLHGDVLPGQAPPDGKLNMTKLYLSGIADFDPLVGGYCLRSPMVGDSLRADGEWTADCDTPQPGSAQSSYLLGQVASVEVLLRTVLRKHAECGKAMSEITVPAPWKGKAAELRNEIVKLVQAEVKEESLQKQLVEKLANVVNTCLPEQLSAIGVARSVLDQTGDVDEEELLDGLTFSDLANLARGLNVVTVAEREELDVINARRNDAAHFRPVQYDEAFQLEHDIQLLLPKINERVVGNEESKE